MCHHLEWIVDWESLARKAQHKAANLAKLNKASLRCLERFFKEKLKFNLHQWLIGTRLRHAAQLLEHGQTQKEVASEVGFETVSALCHFSKKHTAMSPAQYLDQFHGCPFSTAPNSTQSHPTPIHHPVG